MHWYQLGPQKAFGCPWLAPSEAVTKHPDEPCPQVIYGFSL
jgi:hypothetical protein